MKQLSLLPLFLMLITSGACAQNQSGKSEVKLENSDITYTEQDAAIFADIVERFQDEADQPINVLIPEIGKYFLGNEYVAHTLEVNEEEKLIVNLRELDCTTYAENLLALARTLKSENQSFEQFAEEIKKSVIGMVNLMNIHQDYTTSVIGFTIIELTIW